MAQLRPYQERAIERCRELLRQGKRRIVICAPTGSGKTLLATHLIAECQAKGRRAAFVVDRKSLIEQTSQTLDAHGIDHGVVQADHWRFRPHLRTQVCSVQTVARRRWPEMDLLIVDECHALNKTTQAVLQDGTQVSIGLSATPLTNGLGKHYDAIVNVTTTRELIEQGFLVPYRIFSCAEPDMAGVRVVAGEFEERETEKRALQVVGDVVAEYIRHGEGRKFICSAVNTAHVEELQRQFLAAGINAATYTYRDKDEDRSDTLIEYRKPDSTIRGLITVSAASRGFDCPDIGCVIMARPLRSSVAEHIQFFGRGLRISPETAKRDLIVLDHAGNSARLWRAWNAIFDAGVTELDDGKKKPKAKDKPKDEAKPMKCPSCGHLHAPRPFCPNCGHAYPRKQHVEHVPGSLRELIATRDPGRLRRDLWPEVVGFVLEPMGDQPDMDRAQRKAQAIYHELTGVFARARVATTVPRAPSDELRGKIRSNQIRWAHRRRREERAAA